MTPKTKLGHVHLKVRQLQPAVDFYTSLFGLHVTEAIGPFAFLGDDDSHHVVALQELGPLAPSSGPHTTGLYHSAFEVASTDILAGLVRQIEDMGMPTAIVDHGISIAAYTEDPSGNGVEIFVDRRHLMPDDYAWNGHSARVRLSDLESL